MAEIGEAGQVTNPAGSTTTSTHPRALNWNDTQQAGALGLRATLKAAGGSMGSLTVLSTQNDPFRVDTPANHRDGEWLANTAQRLGLADRTIHLRGLHYMVIGQPKPDGLPYTNTDKDWLWLSNSAAKAARFLGYIGFDQIIDNRNTPPVTRPWVAEEPYSYISVGVDVQIPDVDDIVPTAAVYGYEGRQQFRLALFGEKASLEPILGPIAADHQADLFLPTGEISDTQMHIMAKLGAQDGRKLIVFTLSDCDPSGWQMPISIARKLQAFKAGFFPDLEFEVHRVALTPDQVRAHGLPWAALKPDEKRAEDWIAAMGVEQTEIDALAALNPDLLNTMARDALRPFFDHTLFRRVQRAKDEWQEQAQQVLDDAIGPDRLAQMQADAEDRLSEIQEQVDALDIRVDVGDVELPDFDVPEPMARDTPIGLVDSEWDFAEQCHALIASKTYDDSDDRTAQ